MPFKIVQTTERGNSKLSIVPSNWEWKGQLRYPKKNSEFKFARDPYSKPRSEWPVMPCKVKRMGFPTYKDADEELSIMMQHSDTDVSTYGEKEILIPVGLPDFNDIAEQLILQSQANVSPGLADASIEDVPTQATSWVLGNKNPVFAAPEVETDSVTQTLNIILQNQKKNLEAQDKIVRRLGSVVVEIETKVEKTVQRVLDNHLNRTVTSLSECNQINKIENTRLKLKPIDSLKELEEFELLLSDPAEKHKLIMLHSVLCSTSEGHGITCAYKLIDVLFTREFLCKCSWSGGSRSDTIKIPIKGYKNILDFCFKLILSWDKSYTIENNEKFFKVILRNAEQRKKCKHLRNPAMRKRIGKVKESVISEKTKSVKEIEEADIEIYIEETDLEEEGTKETDKEIYMEEETDNVAEIEETVEKENRAVQQINPVDGLIPMPLKIHKLYCTSKNSNR